MFSSMTKTFSKNLPKSGAVSMIAFSIILGDLAIGLLPNPQELY